MAPSVTMMRSLCLLLALLAAGSSARRLVAVQSSPERPQVVTLTTADGAQGTMWSGPPGHASYFRVVDTQSGSVLSYVGPVYKYIPPDVPDTSRDVDLGRFYPLVNGREYSACTSPEATGEEACIVFTHRYARRPDPMSTDDPSHNCTAPQRAAVESARLKAMSGLHNGFNEYIRGRNCFGADYREWFGTPTELRYLQVVLTFNSVALTISRRSLTYNFTIDCEPDGCVNGVVAYVYPSIRDPNAYATNRMHLCPPFWDLPSEMTDFNSQPGTLIHEASHLRPGAPHGADDVLWSTLDHKYGTTRCRELADTDPDKAVDNADNFEFFIESTPDISQCAAEACPSTDQDSCLSNFMCGYCNNTLCIPGNSAGPLNYTFCSTTSCLSPQAVVCTSWDAPTSDFTLSGGVAVLPSWVVCTFAFLALFVL